MGFCSKMQACHAGGLKFNTRRKHDDFYLVLDQIGRKLVSAVFHADTCQPPQLWTCSL